MIYSKSSKRTTSPSSNDDGGFSSPGKPEREGEKVREREREVWARMEQPRACGPMWLLMLASIVQHMLLVMGGIGEQDESLSDVLVATPVNGGMRLFGIPRLSSSTILLALGGAAVLLAASLPRYGLEKI